MAVDTVKKRASVLGIVWPDANGIDQSDRQTILGVYGGVLAGVADEPFVEIGVKAGAMTRSGISAAVMTRTGVKSGTMTRSGVKESGI